MKGMVWERPLSFGSSSANPRLMNKISPRFIIFNPYVFFQLVVSRQNYFCCLLNSYLGSHKYIGFP